VSALPVILPPLLLKSVVNIIGVKEKCHGESSFETCGCDFENLKSFNPHSAVMLGSYLRGASVAVINRRLDGSGSVTRRESAVTQAGSQARSSLTTVVLKMYVSKVIRRS
jgi:hypothetical protein